MAKRIFYRFFKILIPVLNCCMLVVLMACAARTSLPEVLIVTRDQSDTPSLNPSRLLIATELSLLDHNHSRGGKADIKVRIHTYVGDEDLAMAEVETIIEANPSIIALVGDIGSAGTEKLARIADKHQIPHISFFAIDNSIFSRYHWSFSYRATINHESMAMMDILSSYLDVNRVAVIGSSFANNYGRWKEIEEKLAKAGIQIVEYQAFARDVYDFKPYLRSLAANRNFDAVLVFIGSSQMEHLLQQVQKIPLGKPLVVSPVSLAFEALPDLAGLDADIVTTVQTAILRLQNMDDQTLQAFAQRYGVAMGVHRLDPLGLWVYDGIDFLCELIAQSGSRPALFEKLVAYKDVRLPGPVTFDDKHQIADSPFTTVKVKNGRFVEVSRP